MKEKLLRLLREVLRAILFQRGWRQDAERPATPPPLRPGEHPEPPKEGQSHGG
jgi:hypothetical protein